MIDRFGRTISYLRVSVTDRCNLRCRYCMPAGGVKALPSCDRLSPVEILAVVRAAAAMGVTKVRLTGGEPLTRGDISELVRMIAGVAGVGEVCMTTNGTLLAGHARALADAGLDRVNVSLDTTDPVRYRRLTRGGGVRRVFAGIRAARTAGLTPIKLNCVVDGPPNSPDARGVAAFARREGLDLRFIRRMDLASGRFYVVQHGAGGDCPRCNRLRLASDGTIRPCLFSDLRYSVRQLGTVPALRRAVLSKPAAGGPCSHNWMHGIGG